jgi:hypothetical protein
VKRRITLSVLGDGSFFGQELWLNGGAPRRLA